LAALQTRQHAEDHFQLRYLIATCTMAAVI